LRNIRRMSWLIGASLTACATTVTPVPKDYSGPVATLVDSVQWKPGDSCGSWFYLGSFDGKEVSNALTDSIQANRDRGPVMDQIRETSRTIPLREAQFGIEGRTHCAAPIQEMMHTVYAVRGTVSFVPQADATYQVVGELADTHSAVWIIDRATGKQVGNKLLVNGSVKQGFTGPRGEVVQVPPP
jgi:hypothetical protein